MTQCVKLARRLAAGLAILAASIGSSYAACPTTTTGWARSVAGTDGTTLLFKWAVASNFVAATKTLANAYLASLGTASSNYIEICGNSSGTISTEINGYNSSDLFSAFLSADKANITAINSPRDDPFEYAEGIPVFLLSPEATSADPSSTYPALDYMIQGSTGAAGVGTVSTISNLLKIQRGSDEDYFIQYLAIGEPSLAPYGVAAQYILKAMGLDYTGTTYQYQAGTSVSTDCSSLVTSSSQWICTYRNIDYTLQAINNDRVDAGFVSYGQVCSALNTSYPDPKRYIKFPDYPTEQYAVSLYSTNAQQSASDSFVTYLGINSPNSANGFGSTWNTWLSSNCYATI